MEWMRPNDREAESGLRALKSICIADGQFDDLERELLNSVQEHWLHTSYDLDALAEITPEALASDIVDPRQREQWVNGMAVVSMANGEETQEKATCVRAYADALSVQNHLVRDLQLLVDHHLALFRFDLIRRTELFDLVKHFAKDRGVRGLFKAAKSASGHGFDPKEAQRFQRLGLLPEGTVGRAYWTFTRENHFSFPGEPHGPPAPLVHHDLAHVLGGYGTSGAEEIKVAAFQAGALRKDPFAVLIFALCQFHLGIRITPITAAQRGHFQPDDVVRAFKRGRTSTIPNFQVDWDPFSIMERPLDEVRREYKICAS